MTTETRRVLGDALTDLLTEAMTTVAREIAASVPVPEPVDAHAMTVEQVAEFLSLGANRIREMARSGELPHRKSGPRFIFRRQDVIAWEERDLIRSGPRSLGQRVG